MRLTNLKRFLKEDFPEDQQEFVDKMGSILNPFMEQISQAFNKNITMENLSREIVTLDVENGTGGNLKAPTQFKVTLTGRVQGFNILKADNLTNPSIYPTAAPWVSWSINNNIVTVKKVTGIQDNNRYRLTLEIIS